MKYSDVFVEPAITALRRRCLDEGSEGGRCASVSLFSAVITYTRQLRHRAPCFDVTGSLVVLRAAAWSAVIPLSERRLKRLKQKWNKTSVCPINGKHQCRLHTGFENTHDNRAELYALLNNMRATLVATVFKMKMEKDKKSNCLIKPTNFSYKY